jgi:hypothetical protein
VAPGSSGAGRLAALVRWCGSGTSMLFENGRLGIQVAGSLLGLSGGGLGGRGARGGRDRLLRTGRNKVASCQCVALHVGEEC